MVCKFLRTLFSIWIYEGKLTQFSRRELCFSNFLKGTYQHTNETCVHFIVAIVLFE